MSFKRHNLCPLLSVRGFGILDVLFGPTEFSFHKSCTVMMGTGAARPFNFCGSILRSSGNLSKLAVSAGVTFIVHSTDDTRPRSWGRCEKEVALEGSAPPSTEDASR